ncbi:hypothetical protein [Krasilnikovia sp. MM14-A1004]|uniref:hypothetical protein n=1 Tax=Krasilnikovia sp. MM14-A1004 TaxID=3373541 RepID=UPI00399C8092
MPPLPRFSAREKPTIVPTIPVNGVTIAAAMPMLTGRFRTREPTVAGGPGAPRRGSGPHLGHAPVRGSVRAILDIMRQAYAHRAVLVLEPGADERAAGGAITTALCGHWAHEPPCPLAVHHTAAQRHGDELHLRILFATAPDRVDEVRGRIDAALAAGRFTGPEGGVSRWRTVDSGCARLAAEERPHARRLLHGPATPA